jgi:hypothetical protein
MMLSAQARVLIPVASVMVMVAIGHTGRRCWRSMAR